MKSIERAVEILPRRRRRLLPNGNRLWPRRRRHQFRGREKNLPNQRPPPNQSPHRPRPRCNRRPAMGPRLAPRRGKISRKTLARPDHPRRRKKSANRGRSHRRIIHGSLALPRSPPRSIAPQRIRRPHRRPKRQSLHAHQSDYRPTRRRPAWGSRRSDPRWRPLPRGNRINCRGPQRRYPAHPPPRRDRSGTNRSHHRPDQIRPLDDRRIPTRRQPRPAGGPLFAKNSLLSI